MRFAAERIKEGRTATRAHVLASVLLLVLALNENRNPLEALKNVSALRDAMDVYSACPEDAKLHYAGCRRLQFLDWARFHSWITTALDDPGVLDVGSINPPDFVEIGPLDDPCFALVEVPGDIDVRVAPPSSEKRMMIGRTLGSPIRFGPDFDEWKIRVAPNSRSLDVKFAPENNSVFISTPDEFILQVRMKELVSTLSYSEILSEVVLDVGMSPFSDAQLIADMEAFNLTGEMSVADVELALRGELGKSRKKLSVFGIRCPNELVVFGGPLLVMFTSIYSWLFATAAFECVDPEHRSFPWALLLKTGVARAANIFSLVLLPLVAFVAIGLRVSTGQLEIGVLILCAAISTICGFGIVQKASRL